MNYFQASQFKRFKRQQNDTCLRNELNLKVLEIDRASLESVLRDQTTSRHHGGWIGKCPYCAAADKTKNKQAYLTPRETGFVFHCCSCGVSQTVFKFLLNAYGDQKAQEYAKARWDAGELCGEGWNCPLPQKVRERLLREKEERREAYRRAEHEQKAINYEKKYGSSFTESAEF